MSKLQILFSLVLGAGVSLFAGAAVPETAGGAAGHALSLLGSSAVFLGLFFAYNRSLGGGCGCQPKRIELGIEPPAVGQKPDKKATNSGPANGPSSSLKPTNTRLIPKEALPRSLKPELLVDANQPGIKFRNDGADEHRYLEVERVCQGDTSKLVVTVSGYTARDFKTRIRPRLERLKEIRWERPVNEGESRRRMEGVITGSSDLSELLARLRKIS